LEQTTPEKLPPEEVAKKTENTANNTKAEFSDPNTKSADGKMQAQEADIKARRDSTSSGVPENQEEPKTQNDANAVGNMSEENKVNRQETLGQDETSNAQTETQKTKSNFVKKEKIFKNKTARRPSRKDSVRKNTINENFGEGQGDE